MKTENKYIEVSDDLDETVFDNVVQQFTERPTEPINFKIDSYGGSLDTAVRVYNYIKENNIIATALVTGNCMSAATIILCSVPYIYRYAYITSQFLIHSASVPYNGLANKSELSQLTNLIDVKNSQLKNIYSADTKIGEQVDNYMSNEILFNAQDAVTLGFISKLVVFENSMAKRNFEGMSVTNNNKKTYTTFNMNIFNKLKDVINVTTVEGQELPIDKPEVGAACKADDGIYVLEDGTKVTIESNKITEVEKPDTQDGCGSAQEQKKKKAVEDEETEPPVAQPKTENPDDKQDDKSIQSQIDEISKRLDDIASRLSVLESLNTDIINKVKTIQKVQNTASFVSDKKSPKDKRGLRDLMNL